MGSTKWQSMNIRLLKNRNQSQIGDANMIQRTLLILAIAMIVFLIFCSNTYEFYTVEMVNGVRTVHNIKPLWGEDQKVELEFVQQIGSLDETDENLIMSGIWDVDRDDNGNIFVLDGGSVRIQKFDQDGN